MERFLNNKSSYHKSVDFYIINQAIIKASITTTLKWHKTDQHIIMATHYSTNHYNYNRE